MWTIFNFKKERPTIYTATKGISLRQELILWFNGQNKDNSLATKQERWYDNRILDEILERHWLPRTKEIVSCWMSFLEISHDWAVYIRWENWINNFIIN